LNFHKWITKKIKLKRINGICFIHLLTFGIKFIPNLTEEKKAPNKILGAFSFIKKSKLD